ncbi:MAG: ribulose-phosphate 3-epimerase [Bacillota bacterium]|nr:ribulose-phosphate 3-epimerase [Bacillota bacterium]
MKKILCPSMMCADYDNLATSTAELDQAGADVFHCDVMDGCFVPNIAMGLQDIKTVRKNTRKPIDVHLMIEKPAGKVDWFIDAGADIVYIHPESERYCIKTLRHIRNRGVKAGIAINPDTSIETVRELLAHRDYVLAMSVTPGFAGQRFIESVKGKLIKLAELKKKYGFILTLDGACSPEKIKELSEAGVDGFILGTSSLFGTRRDYKNILTELRNL